PFQGRRGTAPPPRCFRRPMVTEHAVRGKEPSAEVPVEPVGHRSDRRRTSLPPVLSVVAAIVDGMQASRPRRSPPAPERTPAAGRRPAGSLAVDGALWLVVLMWASTFTLFKVAWRQVDPVAFTGIRFAAMVVFAFG